MSDGVYNEHNFFFKSYSFIMNIGDGKTIKSILCVASGFYKRIQTDIVLGTNLSENVTIKLTRYAIIAIENTTGSN